MERSEQESNKEASTSNHDRRQIGDDLVKENHRKQLDELLVIQSIFDESILTIDTENYCGRFIAYPNITESPYYIIFKNNGKKDVTEQSETEVQKLEVKYLPRVEFTFVLDQFYPSEDPPAFLISCQWLSALNLSRVCEQLDKLYNESRSEILYSWFTFLRDDLLTFLNSEKELDVTLLSNNCDYSSETRLAFSKNYAPKKYKGNAKYDERVVPNESTKNILRILLDNNEYRREELFANEWFSCNICYSRKKGRDCVMFSCNHTNCTECVKEYFSMQINEGAVYAMKCPQHKCNALVTPTMIQKVVEDELFRRYDELLLTSALSMMNDIVYCPRKLCQSPVVSDSADSDLAVCSACSFAFCIKCKYTYHGVSPCRSFKNTAEKKKILNAYYSGSDAEKEALEKRYGKEILKRELEIALGEILSERWIDNYSKACPKCNTHIEKIDGCNKMVCNRCESSFCWICLQVLSPSDPYNHFRRYNSKCFNKLFAGIVVDDNYNYDVVENENEDDDDIGYIDNGE